MSIPVKKNDDSKKKNVCSSYQKIENVSVQSFIFAEFYLYLSFVGIKLGCLHKV